MCEGLTRSAAALRGPLGAHRTGVGARHFGLDWKAVGSDPFLLWKAPWKGPLEGRPSEKKLTGGQAGLWGLETAVLKTVSTRALSLNDRMTVKNQKPSKPASRSAVTGRQLGRAAQRSETKNSEGAEDFVASIETNTVHRAITLARVTRQVGGGRVELQLYTGETGIYTIAGRIAFRGRAANKTDREACMCVGDYVVVDGAQVVAVLGKALAARAETALHLSCVAALRSAQESTVDERITEAQAALLAHAAFYPEEVEGAEGYIFEEVDVDVDAV